MLYIRAASRVKLTSPLPSAITSDTPPNKIHITEGELTDETALRMALSANGAFPKVTSLVCVLIAYVDL